MSVMDSRTWMRHPRLASKYDSVGFPLAMGSLLNLSWQNINNNCGSDSIAHSRVHPNLDNVSEFGSCSKSNLKLLICEHYAICQLSRQKGSKLLLVPEHSTYRSASTYFSIIDAGYDTTRNLIVRVLHTSEKGLIFITIYVGRCVQCYAIGIYANVLSKPPSKVIHQAR